MTTRRRSLVLAQALALVALATASASAQSSGTTLGLGFGPITAYPEEFEGGGCDGSHVGFNIAARRSVSRHLAIEGSVAWTGSVATVCALAMDALSVPAPADGATYRRTSLAEEIPGETFWATRLGAVLSPWTLGPVTPLLRVMGGRLWSKELWTWTVGAGLRYGLGRHAVVLDVERWNLAYDVTREMWIYRESGPDELQGTETEERHPRPWFVRVGWELTVGR